MQKIIERSVIILFSFMCAMMLTMTFEKVDNTQYQSILAEILDNLRISCSKRSVVSSIIMIGSYVLGMERYDKELPWRWGFISLSFLLSIVWLMGKSFGIDNRLNHIIATPGQIVKSFIYCLGAMYLIYEGICLLNHFFDKSIYLDGEKFGSLWRFINDHVMVVVMVSLCVCWSLPVVTSYPANMCYDAWYQLSQFWGYSTFTSHHPPIHTLLIGFFSWIGNQIGDTDTGLFLFILFQTMLYALVIGYSFLLLKKLHAPSWLNIIYFLITAFTPYYFNYVGLVLKDNVYSISVLLFIIELINLLVDINGFFGKPYHYILSFFSVLGVSLFRNNGNFILYPTLTVCLVLLFLQRNRFTRKVKICGIVLVLISIIASVSLNSYVMIHYDVQNGSIAEALSLPFQQTARTILEHENEITEDERSAIDMILKYDELKENYNPRSSDPVKGRFRAGVSKKALWDYFKVWLKMFIKYPKTYIAATVNQNYILVYPFEENNPVYMNFDVTQEAIMEPLKREVGLRATDKYSVQKEILLYWNQFVFSSPLLGLLSHTALYIIVLMMTSILALCKKRYRYLITALPILLSIVVVIFAPTIKWHPRYSFPIVYTVPVLLAYYIYVINDVEKEKVDPWKK